MKQLSVSITLLFIGYFSFSQHSIPLDSAGHYVGRTVTVCGKVGSAFVTKGPAKTCFLNTGKPYPNTPLTLVIFESAIPHFSYEPAVFLKDKDICVQRKISLYRKRVQMVIDKQSQVTLPGQ